MNILIPLGAFLAQAIGPLARKVLAALGLGVLTFGAITTALTSAINLTKSHYDSLHSFTLNILGLAGVGEAMGMIAGALIFRVSLTTMSRIGLLKK